MTIEQVVAELQNIKEQTLNNSKITLDDVIEAIDDVISDCKDHSMDFTFDDEDDWLMGDRRNKQGKRDDQITFSEIMVVLSLIGICSTIIYYSLYHTISRLVHYIMG